MREEPNEHDESSVGFHALKMVAATPHPYSTVYLFFHIHYFKMSVCKLFIQNLFTMMLQLQYIYKNCIQNPDPH